MLKEVLILSVTYSVLIIGLIYVDIYKAENDLESSVEFIYEGF